ncbi:M61 family metallopeptidase [Mucilaginibacter auburnensis]|uniref:Putative metalloprotease with PDZ domain n=1 Tax=Mucilaginibacter auburnensis TaxID=1457233 RepID=A0A2H9VQU7_9SPHI|nr:PDZ domain-containing protein [Mucilaginibacter auburnensis]PJJ83138.1 putative metalloprotease with PDZ domain [Mucilaginibacter auburnensis]
MKKLPLMLAYAALSICAAFAQPAPKPIYYTVSFLNAAHHEAEITLTIPKAPTGIIDLRMSRSSPGRYATHEFGKNVYNVKAFDPDGTPLLINQVEGDHYEIAEHGEAVKVSYTLFANWTDGTYASVDASHAHLNMPAVFLFINNLGQEKREIRVEFNDLDKYGWKVASQLKHEGVNVYSAPNFQYLMDSPTELSAYKTSSWEVANPDGKKQKINLTIHSADDQSTIDAFGKMVQKVTLEEQAVFGELPAYDYGQYTFLEDIYPSNSGDGMEHRNSTCIVDASEKVAGNEIGLLGTFSHEFFHAWNVERIRPKTLEPFNFTHANISNELWFAEGFTQYYGELILTRAGFYTSDEYTRVVGGLVNAILNTPGAAKYSAVEMSRKAVFTDAGVSIDPNNYLNNFTSYYTYGGAIALALDLKLRSDFNLTLDDYMRAVWLERGKKMKPYTVADLQDELAKLTKDAKFATDFFKRFVNGTDKNDYNALLVKAGLIMRKAQPGKAWIGLSSASIRGRSGQVQATGSTGLTLIGNSLMGSPIYNAGIDAGDVILTADGKKITDPASFNQVINNKKPGDKVQVTYRNRAGDHEATITLTENPAFEIITFEKAGMQPNAAQLAFRNNWLSSKIK